jgi:type II secretory pathway component GspD/PulD (secretin)
MKGKITTSVKSALYAALLGCLMLSFTLPALAAKGSVTFKDNRLSLSASNTPLTELLVEIGSAAGVDIYLSTMVRPGNITLRTENLSLEDSFKRLLKEYSYAAVFTGSENRWKISTIKIFPKGKYEGELVPLVAGKTDPVDTDRTTRTVFVTEGREMPFTSGLPKRGVVAPSAALAALPAGSSAENAPWVILQQQFAQEQARAYQEQMLLKQQIEATTDDEKREALALMYADEVTKFQAMQAAHINQIESIKRIYSAKAAEEKLSAQGEK